MKIYLVNAFSINMLQYAGQDVSFIPVSINAVKNLLKNEQWESAMGHADTARVIGRVLGVEVPVNRVSVTLDKDTSLIVAQYTGPRLAEGATELPPSARINYWQVYLLPGHLPDGLYAVANGRAVKLDGFQFGYEGVATPSQAEVTRVDGKVVLSAGPGSLGQGSPIIPKGVIGAVEYSVVNVVEVSTNASKVKGADCGYAVVEGKVPLQDVKVLSSMWADEALCQEGSFDVVSHGFSSIEEAIEEVKLLHMTEK